jgi:hypothetical protein
MTRSQVAFILGVLGKPGMIRSPPGLEYLPKCGGEERVAIMDQEPQRAEAVA